MRKVVFLPFALTAFCLLAAFIEKIIRHTAKEK